MGQTTQASQERMIIGGGDGAGSTYVDAERLKQVSVPVEIILGAANGAVTGAVVSAGVSAAVTVANHGFKGVGRLVMQNVFKTHIAPVLVGIAAFAGLGGLVRYARASKHNEWTNRHYALMEEQTKGHGERVQEGRNNNTPGQDAKR